MITQREIDFVIDKYRNTLPCEETVTPEELAKLGELLERKITDIHSQGTYADESVRTAIVYSTWSKTISDVLSIEEPGVRADAEVIVFRIRAHSNLTWTQRIQHGNELYEISDKWKKLQLSYPKDDPRIEVAMKQSAILADLGITTLLELPETYLTKTLLTSVWKMMNVAKKRKEELGDSYSFSFHLYNSSLYWRKFYLIAGDSQALTNSWRALKQAARTIQRNTESEDFKEFSQLSSVFSNGVSEILDLMSRNAYKSAKERIISNEAELPAFDYFGSAVEYYDAVSANPHCCGFSDKPDWASRTRLDQLISKSLPSRSDIFNVVELAKHLSTASKNSTKSLRDPHLDSAIELSNSTATWMNEDEKSEAMGSVISFLGKQLYHKNYRDVLMYWVRYLESGLWEKVDGYSTLLRIGTEAYRLAPDEVRNLCLGSRMDFGSVFRRRTIVELYASNLVEMGESLLKEEYPHWFQGSRLSGHSNDLEMRVLITHSHRHTLCLCQGADGNINHYTEDSINGYTLTAANYRFDDESLGYSSALDSAYRNSRRSWQKCVIDIAETATPISAFIEDCAAASQSTLISATPIAYYRFFPIGLLSGSSKVPIGIKYPLMINSLESTSPRNRRVTPRSATFVECADPPDPSYAKLVNADYEYASVSNHRKVPTTRIVDATKDEFLNSISEGEDVVHFYGHGERGRENASPRLITQTSDVVSKDLYALDGAFPFLLTLGCCSAASVNVTSQPRSLDEAAVSMGSSCCLSSRWPVLDKPSSNFMKEFYQRFWRSSPDGINYIDVAKFAHQASTVMYDIENEGRMPGEQFGIEWSSFMLTV
ncbi:MAG: CHAT domain-containing protein [Corynebacterium sp.]|uniref:CHAT domain-containing protein n=1 Tax=Corynebacterium sp. TaxID=1720 RepID=UPI003F9A6E18